MFNQSLLHLGYSLLSNPQEVYDAIKNKSLSELNEYVNYWENVGLDTKRSIKFGKNTISLCHKLKKWSYDGIYRNWERFYE